MTSSCRYSAAAAALLMALLCAPPAFAEPSEREALALRSAEVRERLAALRQDEGELIEAMEALDELVAIESAALAQAEHRVRDSEAALAMIEGDIASTRALLARHSAALEPRLVARYRLGSQGYLPIMLSAQSVPEFLSLRRMLAWVVEADVEAIREVRRLAALLDQQRASLDAGREELEELRVSAASRLTALRDVRREREASLASIRSDRELQERALMAVNRARRALEQRMARMVEQAGADRGFAAMRGRLPRPVPGAITTGFGGGEGGGGGQKIHRGVDIRAPRGTPVRSVAAGRVVHADWLRGYGNLVILDHGGGYYTLMAHMERAVVTVGDELEVGTVVGLVGDSGTFEGAQLYFEIRRGAEALDPAQWFGR